MRILNIIAVAAALTLAQSGVQAAGDIDAGKTKSAPCAACHGADGNSPTGAFPIIAGQYADYIAKTLKDYQTGKRKNPIMAGLVANLTEEDRQDLAAFFASQKSSLYTLEYSD